MNIDCEFKPSSGASVHDSLCLCPSRLLLSHNATSMYLPDAVTDAVTTLRHYSEISDGGCSEIRTVSLQRIQFEAPIFLFIRSSNTFPTSL